MSPESRPIVERLEKVERENRWLKSAAFTVLLLAGAAFMMGQARPTRRIVAQEFDVVDTGGKIRAILDASGGEPDLSLYDTNGKVRAFLRLSAEGPMLRLSDANGKASANLGIIENGPGLDLYDANGKMRLMVGVYREFSSVGLRDPEGNVRMVLSEMGGEPSIDLNDEQGYSAAVGNTDLVTARTGEKSKTSAASVVLFGKDKKVLWKAP